VGEIKSLRLELAQIFGRPLAILFSAPQENKKMVAYAKKLKEILVY